MDKKAFRGSVINEIANLSEEYIAESDSGIYENFINLPEFINARTVFAYISTGREPNTENIIRKALELGKTVALPVSYSGGIMEPHIICSLSELVMGKFGIPSPKSSAPLLFENDIDMIIVPAVTFSSDGARMGRGGGYYDRFLKDCTAFSVGLARDRLLKEVPTEEHDVPVKCVVTERQIYRK